MNAHQDARANLELTSRASAADICTNSRTSSSLVGEKSEYHAPTAMNDSGMTAQMISSPRHEIRRRFPARQPCRARVRAAFRAAAERSLAPLVRTARRALAERSARVRLRAAE